MYQDKIERQAKEAVALDQAQERYSNIFERSGLLPMSFEPNEDVCDATHIARDILINRSNEDVIKLSKAVASMLKIGENLLQSLSMKLLDTTSTRKSVILSEGRSLYLLFDYFDLSGLQIENVQWGELFATLTLMQSAEILHAPSEIDNYDEPLKEYFKQTVQSTIAQLKEEIIDSIARAECLFDKKAISSSIAKSGGLAKANNIEALKQHVIHRYHTSYTNKSNRAAGKSIFKEMDEEDNKLLLLSYADDKPHQFSKWIALFLDGKLKITLKN